jgi:uncharacterized protein YkwD
MGTVRLLAVLPALLVAACATQYYPSDSNPTRNWPAAADCPTPARAASEAETLLRLMNEARAAAGLAALRRDPALTATAQSYACENAARQSLDHVGSDGSDLLERVRRSGLQPALAAENTGLGYASAEAAFAGWMASPHHRENILRPEISLVGIGLADGARPVWVVDFLAVR